jgi:hypothetical protein
MKAVKAANASDEAVQPNFVADTYLAALIYWVKCQHSLGRTVVSTEVNVALAEKWMEQKERDDHCDKMHGSDPLAPPDFKDDKDWPKVKAYYESFFAKKRGVAVAPLAYVIRQSDDPANINATFDTIDQLRIDSTPHTGENFLQDNRFVFDALDSGLAGKAAHTHIRVFEKRRNGRQAWFALCSYYDGLAQLSKRADVAKAAIEGSRFDGKTSRYTFDKFVAVHKGANAELEHPDVNEPYSEKQKVQNLLDRITDSRLANAKESVLTCPQKSRDFDQAVAHLSTVLNAHLRQGASAKRTISQVSGSAKVGGKGGGRKRTRRKGRNPIGHIPAAEYNKLSPEQREKLRQQREKAKDAKSLHRQVAELSTVVDELLERKEPPQGPSEKDGAAPAAGAQFGPAAHNRKRSAAADDRV